MHMGCTETTQLVKYREHFNRVILHLKAAVTTSCIALYDCSPFLYNLSDAYDPTHSSPLRHLDKDQTQV